VNAWYPGEQGGTAVAEVLFGRFNPAGRLPLTWYNSLEDLPPLMIMTSRSGLISILTGMSCILSVMA
jgi:hypothetical protein